MKTANKIMMPNGEEIGIDGLYGKITNCLLEVPQRIKLELNNGVLTLKAGSQVIVPNGFEEDGVTPRFDYVTVESDISINGGVTDGTELLFYRDSQNLDWKPTSKCASGVSDPQTTNSAYYDPQTNKLYCYTSSGVKTQDSLPLCIFKGDGVGVTSINQTFNGLGYIGSTVWVDKGVKGLIPNGRNEDGSLNNKEIIAEKVSTLTYSRGTPNVYFGISHDGSVAINGAYKYKEQENRNWHTNNNTVWNVGVAGVYDIADNGSIVNFKLKQPVNLATKDMVDGQWIPIIYTLISGQMAVTNKNPLIFDLSNILPNDDYDYECIFDMHAKTGTASGNSVEIMAETEYMLGNPRICAAITRTNSHVNAAGSFTAIIGAQRLIKFSEAHSTNTSYINICRLHCYRRIGINL